MAQAVAPTPAPAAQRLKIGLVLGGGGARGAAHVGVLQVLEELRVPVDCVAGTSMGALVAAAYASGIAPRQMADELAQADWVDMFQDSPGFAEMPYRQRRIAQRFVPGSEMGLGPDGVVAPPGVLTGQKIKLFFNQLVRADFDERNIDTLPLPLSIIATDIGNGNRVVLRDGSVTQAMRASMSVPGLMAPLDYRGHKLVDGGLVDNVPVQEVHARCQPDVVIAINVGSPLLPPEKVGSLLSVSAQMINILTEQNVTRSLALLRDFDIYIRPELGNLSAGDFDRNKEAVSLGRNAAMAEAERLRRLTVSPEAYAQWWSQIALTAKPAPVVDAVQFSSLARTPKEAVAQHISQRPGDVLNTAVLNRDLLRIFGEGSFQTVDYRLVTERERKILQITPLEKPWGPDYLRFALNLNSEMRHGSSYNLRASLHRTGLNSLGAESLVSAELGTQTSLMGSFYQPLSFNQRWFVEPMVRASNVSTPIYQNGTRIAEYSLRTLTTELAAGINLGRYGQVRTGFTTLNGSASRDTGELVVAERTDAQQGWFTSIDIDRLDHLYFPRNGWSTQWRYANYPRNGYDKLSARLQTAYPLNHWVFSTALAYTGSRRGNAPPFDATSLGGFLNLSAYARGQFVGDQVTYARMGIEQILGSAPLGLQGDMRLGLAFEVAKVGQRITETQGSGALNSTVIYLGGETPFGPVYLGVGMAKGSSNLYLSLGVR